MSILLTGPSGFIGRHLLNDLRWNRIDVTPVYRSLRGIYEPDAICVGELTEETDFNALLKGFKTVIHLASVNNIGNLGAKLKFFRDVHADEVDWTKRMFEAAVRNRVRHVIFLSSIKIHENPCINDSPLSPDDGPGTLSSPYSRCKWELENSLRALTRGSRTRFTIIRAPAVYGKGMRGNINKLVWLIRLGVPLPLGGGMSNSRSYISVHNLVELIRLCVDNELAYDEIFLPSDNFDLSTLELCELIAKALDVPLGIFTIPRPLHLLLRRSNLFSDMFGPLYNSLRVDPRVAMERLGWAPKSHMLDVLREAIVR